MAGGGLGRVSGEGLWRVPLGMGMEGWRIGIWYICLLLGDRYIDILYGYPLYGTYIVYYMYTVYIWYIYILYTIHVYPFRGYTCI
jgi:hypothetical protein